MFKNAYKDAFKTFFKTKFLAIAFAIGIGGSILFCGYQFIKTSSYPASVDYKQMCILEVASVIFIFFLFLSFSYFSKMKQSNLDECIEVTPKGIGGFWLAQFSVMATLSLIVTAVFSIFNIGIVLSSGIKTGEYLLFSFKLTCFYFFLVPLVGILFAMVCSALKKKPIAYVLMAIMVLMTSPLSEMIANPMYITTEKINLFPLADMFLLYPRTFNRLNSSFSYPLLSPQVQLVFAWIFLLTGIGALLWFRKKKIQVKAISAGSLVISILLGVLAVQPASTMKFNPDPVNGFFSDAWYYMPSYYAPNKPKLRNEDGGFKATAYDLDLSMQRLLKAKATVSVDNQNLEEYKFTLYHGYKISLIENQNGEKLDFKMEDDYCTVFPKGKTEKLTFSYKGFHAKFYSNSQGTFLPTGFPYYPISGFHVLFDLEPNQQGRVAIKLPNAVPFNISVDSKKKMFCNLPENEPGQFSGSSDGLTLMSGFLEEMDFDGKKLIYPYLDTEAFTDEMFSDFVGPFFKKNSYPDIQKIFYEPNMNLTSTHERFFQPSDHILACNIYDLDRQIEESKVMASKLSLYWIVTDYGDVKSLTPSYVAKIKGDEFTQDEIEKLQGNPDYQLAKMVISVGEEVALEQCKKYVLYNNDKRTPEEFFASMQ